MNQSLHTGRACQKRAARIFWGSIIYYFFNDRYPSSYKWHFLWGDFSTRQNDVEMMLRQRRNSVLLSNERYLMSFGVIHFLRRWPRGEGRLAKFLLTKQPYFVKLSTNGEEGSKDSNLVYIEKGCPPRGRNSIYILARICNQ